MSGSVRAEGRERSTERWLLALFGLSGAAALGIELALSRLLADAIGGAALATAAVGAAYLGGIALGSLAGGRSRPSGQSPLARYALLEFVGAAWALALPACLPWLRRIEGALSAQAVGRVAVAVLALLPVALCGGATLPICARGVGALGAGRLYATNALGGALGAVATGLWLLPRVGLWGSCAVGAALQLAVAASALALARRPAAPPPSAPPLARAAPLWRPLTAAALLGASGLCTEVLWARLLLPWLGGTSTALAGLLGLYLLGLGLGAALAAALLRARPAAARFAWLFPTVAGLCQLLLGRSALGRLDGGLAAQAVGHAWALAAAWILPTTTAFGAATPLLFVRHGLGRPADTAVAEVAAAAGLGSAVGALAAPLLLAPLLGARAALLVACVAAIAAALPLVSKPSAWVSFLGLAALAGLAVPGFPLRSPLPPGLRLVARAEGPMAEAWAVEEPIEGARGLIVNGRLREGGTALEAREAERLAGHVPLLWHRAPQRALFLGVGTGISLAAAAEHPGVATTGVELLPEVLQLLPAFEPYNRALEQSTLVLDDARSFLPAHPARFDVIMAELFYPWEIGAGGLYSVEQYREVRSHLRPGGLFCQWLPLYLLSPRALSVVAASLRAVFPHTAAIAGLIVESQPQVALCGSADPIELPPDVDARVARIHDGGALLRLWGHPAEALASLWLFGDEGVRALAEDAPPETDLRPRVEFLCKEEARPQAAVWVGRPRDPDWVQNLRRVVQLAGVRDGSSGQAGRAGQARLALWTEALALGDGDFPRALDLQAQAVALAPWLAESALPGLRLEGTLRKARRYDEAEALLARAASALEPDDATLSLLGTLRLRAGDATAAEAYLRRATADCATAPPGASERCAHALDFLGLALSREGHPAQATYVWRRALAQDPKDGRARRYLGAAAP